MSEVEEMGEHHALAGVKPGGVLFDVGCNKGSWSHMALRICDPVAIYCFEPQKDITEIRPRMRLVNAAMGAAPGFAVLRVYADNEKSTFYRKSPEIEKRHARFGITYQHSINVQVRSVDDYCAEYGIDHVDFLKIDAEGHDVQVMLGAINMMKNIDRIQFEYGGCYHDAKQTLRAAFHLLAPTYRIRKVTPSGLGPALTWSDSLETYEYSNFLAERI